MELLMFVLGLMVGFGFGAIWGVNLFEKSYLRKREQLRQLGGLS